LVTAIAGGVSTKRGLIAIYLRLVPAYARLVTAIAGGVSTRRGLIASVRKCRRYKKTKTQYKDLVEVMDISIHNFVFKVKLKRERTLQGEGL